MTIWRRLIFCALVGAVLLVACTTSMPASTTTPEPTGVPRFTPTKCWFSPPLGLKVDCGYLTVAEDHAKPDGPTLQLAVARFKSRSPEAASDPVVYLESGPGVSPLRTRAAYFQVDFGPLLEKRDVILFDQRGTGYSQPALDCPELTQQVIDALDRDVTTAQSTDLLYAALLQCRARLIQSGVNLAVYNTSQSAADLNDLRMALGYSQIDLYGLSYGSRLALTTMRDFPSGIRSVVIDSALPLQVDPFGQHPANAARAFNLLFDTCAADPVCNAAYPDLRRVFFDLVDRLNQQPAHYTMVSPSGDQQPAHLNGDKLMGFVFESLGSTSLIPLVPRLIYNARNGQYDLVAGVQSALPFETDKISAAMHYSVQCQEEIPFSKPEDVDAVLQQFPEYRALAVPGAFDFCREWGLPPAQTVEHQPVASDIPTLILSGQFDPMSPPNWSELAANTLSHSFSLEVPGAGLGAGLTRACARSMVAAFFENPSVRPDTGCLTDKTTALKFAIPLRPGDIRLGSFRDINVGIEGAVPTGWEKAGPITYSPSGQTNDLDALIQSAAPSGPDVLLNLLTNQMNQAGVEFKFKPAGTRSANDLTWSLYTAQVTVLHVDLALAQGNGKTYLVVLRSIVDERSVLYGAVFLPAIDAFKPLQK